MPMTTPVKPLQSKDAIKTYRYLRIGMIGAVVLLATSILIEHGNAHCWQDSISAYYYTPVRAIFVGSMIAVGFALIVIKGRDTWEDTCLNFAGMLAPVVAIAPTTDVGKCWSVPPEPRPILPDGSLAHWVVANIDNNFKALLVTGALGLLVAAVLALAVNRGVRRSVERIDLSTIVSLAVTGAALLFGWWLFRNWDDFDTKAHGRAAVAMFVFLIGAVAGKAYQYRARRRGYFWTYAAVAALMALGGIAIAVGRIGGQHTVFVLEAFEILLFAVFWIVQTVENWHERVVHPDEAPAQP